MPLTIDHTAIVVPAAKLDDVVKFLLAALEPLGLKEMMRPIPNSVGLGDQTPFFWVTGIEGDAKTLETVVQREHTAFSASGESCLVEPTLSAPPIERASADETHRQHPCRQIL